VGPGDFETAALVHLDSLYRAALRLSGDPVEAEDLTQETWLKAWKSFGRFRPGTDCRVWLFTILKNTFLNHRRDQEREALLHEAWARRCEVDADIEPSLIANPEDALSQRELPAALARALEQLPPLFRQSVILADVRDLTYREIAGVTGWPLGTVMSRLWRGRRRLRRSLVGARHETPCFDATFGRPSAVGPKSGTGE
jgi:RNA polymerase sigma-70 factor, ECF subfamily